MPLPPVNSHIHLPPNFSAFESVEQAVSLASKQGVRALGASNYYDYRVYREFQERCEAAGILPLYGIEIIALLSDLQAAGVKINDPGNPGRMYLCGKGITRFDPLAPEAAALLEGIRHRDSARMAAMSERLEAVFAAAGLSAGLDEAAIKAGIVRRHGCTLDSVYLQERHLAQAYQEALFERVPQSDRSSALARLFGAPPKNAADPAQVQSEIRTNLIKAGRPAYVEETFVGFDHAYRLILALGGIPAYPTLADGANPICPFEDPVEKLIDSVRERAIHMAEFIPIRNSPKVLGRYVTAMRAAGLAITAGTEHNTLDLLPIATACAGGVPIPADVREIFFEGACVAAAHQQLMEQGEPGFVDLEGKPNPAYRTAHERIAAFSAIGRDLILGRAGAA